MDMVTDLDMERDIETDMDGDIKTDMDDDIEMDMDSDMGHGLEISLMYVPLLYRRESNLAISSSPVKKIMYSSLFRSTSIV
jgi:hypothetical protein